MAETIRPALRADAAGIHKLITGLAEYENMLDKVTGTAADLEKELFDLKSAEALVFDIDGEIIGYAIFFGSFSTFLCRHGIYLEDLYIKPEYRGKGYGKRMLRQLASLAIKRGCARLEWNCLDWNEPSIRFYLGLGAERLDPWTEYRLTENTLSDFANGKD